MGRTFLRQDTQIRNSDLYDDNVAAGSTLESGVTTLEGDLNSLRSQVNRLLKADGSLNWYDDIVTINGKKRSVRDLNFDLDELEEQKTLRRVTHLADITVASGKNWVILSAAASEVPTLVAAVATTAVGAVVAQSALNGAGFNVHELIEQAGPNTIEPKNLLLIRNATTGEIIQSSGREVFGLLQYESTGVDGGTFNDTSAGNRVKISFVRQNSTFDDLEACTVADIETQVINYAYVARATLDNLPEEAWINSAGFVDFSSTVGVTLDAAVDNQLGNVTQVAKNILWLIDDTFKLAFQDSTGSADIFAIIPLATGDKIQFNGAIVDINNTSPVDLLGSLKVNTGAAELDIGVNAGVIESISTNDLRVLGAGELYLDDGHQTGSTWAQTSGIKLSATTAEWDAYETAFGGEISLLKGIAQAKRRTKTYALVTSTTVADTDVGGASGGANLDAQLPDLSIGSFITDYDVFLNGELLRGGANSSANHDYYPGTSLANGQLKFEFSVKLNDQITVIPYVR